MALVAASLLLIVVICSSAVAGVWRGAVAPPWFDYAFATVHLVGYRTWNANCQPYTGCAPTRDESYVIWLAWQTGTQQRGGLRLLSIPIVH